VDPGALLWLAKHSVENLDDLLETRSGLQGLAGTSDLREVLRRRGEGEPDATLAFEVYLHRLVTHVGAMVAAMQGLDALVFAGGAGECSRPVREELCSRLASLGVRTSDDDLRAPRELTTGDARTRTFVVHHTISLESHERDYVWRVPRLPSRGERHCSPGAGSRPMKPSRRVCTSASSGTGTRGPLGRVCGQSHAWAPSVVPAT
jgi:hypothetical protein